jgi:hypothetical protein
MAFMMGKGYHTAPRHWWFNCACCALTHRDSAKVGRIVRSPLSLYRARTSRSLTADHCW